MGRRVVRAIVARSELRLAAAVGRAGSAHIGRDAGELAGVGALEVWIVPAGPGCFGDADVVVDFSLPEGLLAALPHLGTAGLVSGVTGLDAAGAAAVDAAAGEAPVLLAANFSTGVHVLADLVARATQALPAYDVEVVEAHHRHKRDAPSGTALFLGEAAARGRDVALEAVHGREGRTSRGSEIGFHALRCGDVVGEHEVWLAGEGERLRLGHVATSRDAFALGAVQAACWLAGRRAGRYTMRDVLGL